MTTNIKKNLDLEGDLEGENKPLKKDFIGPVLEKVQYLLLVLIALRITRPKALTPNLDPTPVCVAIETPTISVGPFMGLGMKHSYSSTSLHNEGIARPVRIAAAAVEHIRAQAGSEKLSTESSQAQSLEVDHISVATAVDVENQESSSLSKPRKMQARKILHQWLTSTSPSRHQESLKNKSLKDVEARVLIDRLEPKVFDAKKDLLLDTDAELLSLPKVIQRQGNPTKAPGTINLDDISAVLRKPLRTTGPSDFGESHTIPRTPTGADTAFFPTHSLSYTPRATDLPSSSMPVMDSRSVPTDLSSQTVSLEEAQSEGDTSSESFTSNQRSTEISDKYQRIRTYQDGQRRLQNAAGKDSIVYINKGEDNKLNDANTGLEDYHYKKNFRKVFREEHPKQISKKAETQYDHPQSSTSHDSLNPSMEKGQSYEHGAVLSTPVALHDLKGHVRREQEDYNVSTLPTKNPGMVLGLEQGTTLIDESLCNEMVDLDIVRNMSPEIEAQYGIDKATTLEQTSWVHAKDRQNIRHTQRALGFTPQEHYTFVLSNKADRITLNGLPDLNLILAEAFENPLITPKSPEFISMLDEFLSHAYKNKIYRESSAHLFKPYTNVRDSIQHSGNNVNFNLKQLINLTESHGIDLSDLGKYNSDVESKGSRFTAKKLIYAPCHPEELLNDKSKIDLLGQQLGIPQSLRGTPRVLPRVDVIKNSLGFNLAETLSVTTDIGNLATIPEESTTLNISEESSVTTDRGNVVTTPEESTTLNISDLNISEESSVTTDRGNVVTTPEESTTLNISEEESSSSISRKQKPLQDESTDPETSNTKATRLKKLNQTKKKGKVKVAFIEDSNFVSQAPASKKGRLKIEFIEKYKKNAN